MEALSEFVFFRALYDFLHSEIDKFAIDLLARTMALVSAAALSVLTLWILIRGYRIVTGQSPQPMMGLVVDTLRTTLILGFACGMALGGSNLYEFLGSDLPNEISRVVTGDTAPINEQIDRNLALMQIAVGRIDALDVMGDTTLDSAKDRASWFAGLGTAGPAMSGGFLLLMNQIALALFIGLGPLFVLSLLFEQTKGLFGKWLYFGIGTMFSLAVLSAIVSIALDMVLKVGAAFWTTGVLMGSADGLTSLAMQQGCLGLVLTILILSAPPMAAQFFNGVLGNFSPRSAFGGGGGRNQPQPDSPAYSGNEPDTATASPVLAFRHSPSGVREGNGDEIKRAPEATTDDFRGRYPNALASNGLIGGGDALPAASTLVAMGAAATAQDGYLRDLISPEKLQGLLAFQEDVRQRHPSDSDYAAARRATSDGFNAEISSAAEAYAKKVATDPDMPMQEKYDRLYGMGAKAGSAGFRLGIDYPEHGPIGGEADSIGRKAIDTYNLYNPSVPTTIYVENASDAAPHLRNLLGVTKDADISHMTLNHDPNEVYSSSGQFAIRNEDHSNRYDLVGQIVQQQGVMDALPHVIAKHTFESVDNFAHGGESGLRRVDKITQDNQQPYIVIKESKTQAGRQLAKAVVGIGLEARTVAEREHMTIDVFASKEEPSKRYFEVRKYEYDVRINDFVERAPPINEKTIQSLLHPNR